MRTDFVPDCQNCAGLCCLALAFDEGPRFGFDKPAGLPCRHLGPGASCRIYARLSDEGFSGCADYSCLGAGQIVVQQIFDGASWQDDPELTLPMIDAFAKLREIQDLRAQLEAAAALELDEDQAETREELAETLAPESWTAESLADFDLAGTRKAFRAFVTDLRAGFDVGPTRGSA